MTGPGGSRDAGAGAVTPGALRGWVHLATELLARARPVIDQANVFPVADADTGTNMCLTLDQGRASVDALPVGADVHEVLDALAEGALLGARGNSGVILSEYLRGFAGGARAGRAGAEVAMVVAALVTGSRCAYEAVGRPRRGTILTAAEGAANAAQAALDSGADLADVLQTARSGAHDALRRSAEELDVLGAAGVLDAGAYGLVLVLDALCRALGADARVSAAAGSMDHMTVMSTLSVEPPVADAAPAGLLDAPIDAPLDAPGGPAPEAGDGAREVDGEFEVMYVVEQGTSETSSSDGSRPGAGEVAAFLRAQLREIGDSVAVVGGPTSAPVPGAADGGRGLWQVHVHTDQPLEALRIGRRWTQRQVVVRSLAQQVSRAAVEPGGHRRRVSGIVACTAAPGLVVDLARAGAVVVLRGSVPVVAADLRRAVEETGADEVLVLPADRETWELARDWAAGPGESGVGAGRRVDVAPSLSDLHVVAAMARWATSETAPTSRLVAEVEAAVDAVRAVRVPDAEVDGVRAAVSRLADGDDGNLATLPTVLTVLADDDVAPEVLDALAREAGTAWPGIDVVVLTSGRASTSLVLGVE